MSVATGLMVYAIIWWTVIFAVLPWGVRPAETPGEGQGFFYLKGVRDGGTIRGLGVTSAVEQRVPAVTCQ